MKDKGKLLSIGGQSPRLSGFHIKTIMENWTPEEGKRYRLNLIGNTIRIDQDSCTMMAKLAQIPGMKELVPSEKAYAEVISAKAIKEKGASIHVEYVFYKNTSKTSFLSDKQIGEILLNIKKGKYFPPSLSPCFLCL